MSDFSIDSSSVRTLRRIVSHFSIEISSVRPFRREDGELETQLETALKILKKKFKWEIRKEVERHSSFEGHSQKRRKRVPVPFLELSPLAELLLKKEADTLLGRGEDPFERSKTLSYDKRDDKDIVGTIVTARSIETGEYLLTLDILKQLDPTMPRWGFPGGHREPGENLIMAAIREFKEEVGIDLDGVPMHRVGSIKLRKGAGDSEEEKRSAVFSTALPMAILRSMRPGEEQENLMLADDDLIIAMIEDRTMLTNHVNVYRLFRNWHRKE